MRLDEALVMPFMPAGQVGAPAVGPSVLGVVQGQVVSEGTPPPAAPLLCG